MMPLPPTAVTQKTDSKTDRTHPWRDNIEAITVSIIIIVLFKYFILEAYKIPTGSMQPTLMGWDDGKGVTVPQRSKEEAHRLLLVQAQAEREAAARARVEEAGPSVWGALTSDGDIAVDATNTSSKATRRMAAEAHDEDWFISMANKLFEL